MNSMTKIGLLAASGAAMTIIPVVAKAATHVPAPTGYRYEKCYGVNASGKNDCAVRGVHSCGAESRIANDPKSWIYVPAGTCTKITGGSKAPKA